jgi:hypothetical protein
MSKAMFRNIFVASLVMVMSSTGIKAANFDVSNLTESIQGSEVIAANNIVKRIATSFSTGNFAGTADIDLVQLYLSSFGTYNLASLNVSIFTDNSGTPGTSVGSLSATGSLTGNGLVDFRNTTTPVALQPSTNYWVVIKNSVVGTGLNNIQWAYGYPSGPTPGLNGQVNDNTAVNLTGATWNAFAGTSQLVRITNVPEPSTYALGAIGALTIGYINRRRRAVQI